LVPVLQGWTVHEYLRHHAAYTAAWIDLSTLQWRERLLRSFDIDPPAGGVPSIPPRLVPGTLAA
jgi:hypothetical protein